MCSSSLIDAQDNRRPSVVAYPVSGQYSAARFGKEQLSLWRRKLGSDLVVIIPLASRWRAEREGTVLVDSV